MSKLFWMVVVWLWCKSYELACDKSRHVLVESWGMISHGPPGSNYTQDSHCEWLIKANSSQEFINLRFLSMGTECSYDYVYVFDGDSFGSVLLGSFSGKTEPQDVVATSGFMLILLYSDTNYVLEGFRAEYSITNCPGNCSGNGDCLNHSCICERQWGGNDCSVRLCPDDCGGPHRGICVEDRCNCRQGYSGRSCSLDRNDTTGNKWHWLSNRGLKARASHSTVYIKETDSLYVFGGYDLNHVLGDLAIYKFNSSQWVDHLGNILPHLSGWSGEVNAELLKEAIYRIGLDLNHNTFLKTTLLTIADNTTTISKQGVKSGPKMKSKVDGPFTSNRGYSKSPSPRYAHAASEYPGGFVVLGGRLVGGRLCNELWLYDTAGGEWTLRAATSLLQPPALASHTLTLAHNGWLYVTGGILQDQKFNSKIYRIKLSIVGGDEVWEEIVVRGGKESDLRLVGHTTVYLSQSSSLLIYGGIAASIARFSKLSDRMFSFTLESRLWTEIHYPRSHSPSVPSHRAFHSASVIGNYLVIFGGYTHKHNKEEICYDNQIYLYHLGCHTWVNHDILGPQSPGWRYPKNQGVFSHGAGVRNGNTLLIVGGYHGNVNADLLAFLLPPTLASRDGERYEPELICSRHSSLSECTSDPECGWCSADDSCQGRTVGVNCTTNLQTTRCPGVCPALSSCHGCLARSPSATAHPATASVAAKLRLSQCTWCVQNARCHHKHDNYGVCGVKEDTPSQAAGWWGDKGLEVSDAAACSQLDRRPGLTFILYKHPVDYTQPDYVSIMNASAIELRLGPQVLRIPGGDGTQMQGSQVVRLRGFLRPADSWSNEHLRLCVSHAQAILKLAPPDSHNLEVVANVSSDGGQCKVGAWPGGGSTTLQSGRHLIDLEATTNLHPHRPVLPAQQSKIELQHNKSLENPKVFTFEYLEPYESTDSCSLYSNCLACLIDSKCGWCQLKQTCYNRNIDEANICQGENDWQYLVVEPWICVNCSNHASCEDCLESHNCEWSPSDARCLRHGRSINGVVELDDCPSPCHKRSNCTQCLDGSGRCVWCQSTQECFSFSVYTSQYQYGICREWLDGGTGRLGAAASSSVCPSCRSHTNCSTCLQTLGCGWCYDTDKPIVGVCVQGDFTRPQDNKCSYEVSGISNTSLVADEAAWSYAQCPDVDECGLGIHDCHPQAKCTNTHGSYTCQCKRGYIGDGRHSCTKTCYNKCVHGYCVGSPHYTCQCDLGWTGPDCSISCGCNNHSKCSLGVNICDLCNDWTTGEFCQFCKAGSYGNATSLEGCRKCNCNDHGNTNLDVCNSKTGLCFCKDNTEGASCDKCKKGFYGDPRRGGTCYYECRARGMLNLSESQGLGSRLAESSSSSSILSHFTNDCLWILSAGSSDETPVNGNNLIELTIDSDIKVPCTENSVYVYDGLPHFVSSGVSSTGSHQSQVLGVFCTQDTSYPVTVQAKSGYITVHYKQGNSDEGFNATVSVLSCPDRCPKERLCIQGKCVCQPGSVGPKCQRILCPNNCSSHLKQGECDKGYGRCVCASGWGGWDCSQELKPYYLVFTELFNSIHLSDSLDHLRKMLPRFGHSLLTDRRGSLWLFGGYSLSHGPLNDIRLFDTKNNTWMQVTVDSTNDANMPRGRYFHAAEISQSRREIYVHGGLTNDKGNSTLGDFWKFNLKAQRWIEMEGLDGGVTSVAGHTLTLRKSDDQESLLLIGGFNLTNGFFNSVWEFDLSSNKWKKLNTSGNPPAGVYGHSTVYHSSTQSFYIYGGVVYSVNTTSISNKLYAFHYPTLTWTVLPVFSLYNPSSLPGGRLLHSAVTTDDYMIVFGGRTEPPGSNDTLIAYSYTCNLWISLLTKGIKVVGVAPPVTYAHAMTVDSESGNGKQVTAYIMGGFTGSTTSHVTKLSLPADLCTFSTTKDKCKLSLGCSFCSVSDPRGNSSYCYSNDAWRPVDVCHNLNGTQHTTNGVKCGATWISYRTCSEFTSCTDCLARWPYAWNETQVCKWCSNCGVGKCIRSSEDCSKEAKCSQIAREVTTVSFCPELQCSATDCSNCLENNHCAWTRQVLKTPEEGMTISAEPVYAWNCVSEAINERSSYKLKAVNSCSLSCSQYSSCESCLASQGGEGGWAECRWSASLSECISPAHQPIYCSGGICGRVLSKQDSCPQPCNTYSQCSTCLSHAHCGWCSTPFLNTTGQGLCWEGSVSGPSEGKTCAYLVLASTTNLAGLNKDRPISWHYLTCPPEDECSNGHHSCDATSETCVDTPSSYNCDCAKGYRLSTVSDSTPRCVPVCIQGCVRGSCIAPGNCSCDFGYVGSNCSIQCQCNGHSDCAGPDKLDTCLNCKNNTQGEQCSRCKALFVGDPSDNGQCVPCIEYCNGHTWLCINDSLSQFNFTQESSRSEIERSLTQGPTTRAKCIGCSNSTKGDKCEDCLEGYFRGSDDQRTGCRPCQCHGHGDSCDPVTGERCNCGNNTESEPGCKAVGGQQCWALQCSRCKESYMGTPTLGHQCYKQMSVDLRFCFDSKLIDECKLKPRPLSPKHTVFFAVQPRFMNVDIRITIDVTQGNVDLYMSPRDDTFIVKMNSSVPTHFVELDSRYQWKTEPKRDGLSGGTVRLDTGSNGSSNGWQSTHLFHVEESQAKGLSTYVKVNRRNTILMVRNLTDRLVITLPQDKHDLGSTRFYIAMAASSRPAYGTIFFRQDQLHIDLFVFFSVFFSCFFLFLAACVVAWKAKQAGEARRARRRHVVEMLHMAQRPFATVTVVLEGPSKTRSSSRKSPPRPIAVEPTRDNHAAVTTVLVRLPGGSEPLGKLAIASSLVSLNRTNPLTSRPFLRRRSNHS